MLIQVAPQRFEVGIRTLAAYEAQLYELARGIIHEHGQRAGLGTILQPAVLRTVALHQLTIGLATKPRLVERVALLAGQPQPGPTSHLRNVSRDTSIPCRSASASTARVGPKSR